MKLQFYVLFLVSFIYLAVCVKLCKRWEDYDFTIFDDCKSIDVDDDVEDFVVRWGYITESYQVVTEDNYVLIVFHILCNANSTPVFLQHGIYMNALGYVNRDNMSLAYNLCQRGFDVWIGNYRGTKYSRHHLTLNMKDIAYWNYSVHELGAQDIKAQVNLVNRRTQKKIIYIGFSMGTTGLAIYCSLYPEEAAEKLKLAVSLAPIIYMPNLRTPARHAIPLWPKIKVLLDINQVGDLFGPSPVSIFLNEVLCFPTSLQMRACSAASMVLFGFDIDEQDPQTLPLTIWQDQDRVAVGVINFYIQQITSGRFSPLDYGPKKNSEIYGEVLPPEYPVEKIKVPQYLVVGPNDWLSSWKDCERFYYKLSPEYRVGLVNVTSEAFSHGDFIVAKDVNTLLHKPLLKFLSNYR